VNSTERSLWWAAAVGAVAVLVVFQFFGNATHGYIDTSSLFYWWGYQWVNPASEGEHGWLILGLSGWLFWRSLRSAECGARNAELGQPEAGERNQEHLTQEQGTGKIGSIPRSAFRDPPWPALVALLAGLAIHALGFAAQQTRISIVGFLMCTWGLLRLAGGVRWGRAGMFPLAFLLFAIPLNLLDSIGFWLRVWVVNASATIAHTVGIGVLKSGTQLTAPDGTYNYDVAAACSGIRSLTAMTALSLLAGYINFGSWQRRVAVLLLCFPLVYVGNVARIVAIVVAARIGGPKWGDVAHEVMGYGIFAIVLSGVLLGIQLIRRWWPEPAGSVCHPLNDKPECHLIDDKRVWAATAVVVALAGGEIIFLRHLAHLPARGQVGVMVSAEGRDPVELPAFIGTDWIGRRAEVSPVERQVLPQDTGYSRKDYVLLHDPRRSVFLSIVLSGRDRSSIHRPEICLVGQGWTIAEVARHRFKPPRRSAADFEVTLLRVRREVQTPRGKAVVPQLVAYWFVGGDCIVATHWQRMLRDAWNRVVHARSDRWAYVLMQTDASDGEPAALARMQSILDATLPAFQKVFAPQKPQF